MPRLYYVSLILVAINVAVFIVQALLPGFTESFLLRSADAGGRPWILLTSTFLHGNILHLSGNMFALGLFGIILENFIGSKKLITIYFASGIIASLSSVYFYESALGASGAIFGVLGALAAIRPRMVVFTYGVPMPMFAAAAFWMLLDIAGVFFPSSIANIAHIAGLVFGAGIGIAMRKSYPEPKAEQRREELSDEQFEEWEDEWM